ncbi:DUF2336 domain-containing protein [Cohaesibacter celericrescens]|uniref:DUF2336 domain-containing protein n=1 Tax=Cohaesibacter celericrescens TaxID=2067669 RepID=A0A2N5XUI7_9HYPH|nr:DUF2336 domain-containing protein [Cohaesibacter celericrescens]PLW78173.1 hypothetical protein C0081_05880 [Cohaesibacter celericrescens]
MLDTISDLAREKSSDKRRELLGRVADMFFDGAEHHSQHEALIFRDIVLKMLDDVDMDGRAEFSQRVAPQETLPADVARQLAQDDVTVAGPMLQHSPVLTDEDFVAFSQTLSQQHLESIAQRETLSGTVTDALIENGTREVWHKVTQNHGAEITPKGFDSLVENASGDQNLQASLSARPDITEAAAKALLPLLPPEGKRRLAKLFATNSEAACELVDLAQKRVVAEKFTGRKGRIETKMLIADVKEGKADFSEVLIQLTDANRGPDVILLLAAIADMDEAVVSNAFYQANEDPIAILCKSLDTSVEAYTKLIGMRSEKLKLPLSAAGRSIVHYKDLDISSSRRAMRFVQMRNNLG